MEYTSKHNERRMFNDRRSFFDRRSPYEEYRTFPLYDEFDQTRQDTLFDSCCGYSSICEFLACHKICDE